MRYILGLAVFLMIAGCSTTYVHPTKTESQFYADQNRCINQGYAALPVQEAFYMTSGRTSSVSTNCNLYGSTANCSSSGGNYTPPQKMVTNADVNSFRRSSFVHNCLQGLGYREAK
jgi:hypothetical protein